MSRLLFLLACLSVPTLAACGDDEENEDSGARFLVAGDVVPGCSTGVRWTGDEHGSALMHPGGDCNGCHESYPDEDDVPAPFTVAGTVHGVVDDEDDCAGVEGIIVRIRSLGEGGGELVLRTNAAGNFYSHDPISPPYEAEVELDGRIKAMGFQPSDGNCTSCHTQTGFGGAPGRINAP